jgi:hypothetical protein
MNKGRDAPPLSTFTPAERRLIRRLNTPAKVQRWLNALPYNTEKPPLKDSLRGFREVVRRGTAHCLEAALFAACVMEQHGYPPLVMSLASVDLLDHVIFVYRRNGRWGSVARSRDPGLHGRKAVFRSPRALALSYFDPYVDHTGALFGYADCRPARRGTLRLAVLAAQRLGGGEVSRRLSAPQAAAPTRAREAAAALVSRLSQA